MQRIYLLMWVSILLVIVNITVVRAQNVGVGTAQPDASAALDITSNDKGLLIPRVDLTANNIQLPATALMVFNTNANYGGGAGIYINMGTSAQPQWTQLVPANSGGFVRNQTSQQPASNFNISGTGIIAGYLGVGQVTTPQAQLHVYSGTNGMPVLVESANPFSTGIMLRNTGAGSSWILQQQGTSGGLPGTFNLASSSGNIPIRALPNGHVGINNVLNPIEALQVNGNIRASGGLTLSGNLLTSGNVIALGNVVVDVEYVNRQVSISGNARQSFYMECPVGKKLIGGGGGHRDFNSAMSDITIHYSGPDPSANGARWRFFVRNTNSSSRALLLYCICAKVQ